MITESKTKLFSTETIADRRRTALKLAIALAIISYVCFGIFSIFADMGLFVFAVAMGCAYDDGGLVREILWGEPRDCSTNARSSINSPAFDKYYKEELARINEERQQFADFRDHLQYEKDKAEFDKFKDYLRNK